MEKAKRRDVLLISFFPHWNFFFGFYEAKREDQERGE